MKNRTTLALVVAALAAGVFAATVLATTSSGVGTTTIAKSLFDEFKTEAHTLPADIWQAELRTQGPSDVYAIDNKFSPKTSTSAGGNTGWHSHPGPSLIFVISGTLTNYDSSDPSCAGHDYSAGQGFIDPAGTVHEIRNNTTAPAEVLAIQILSQGAPRKIDANQPSNCNS